MVEKFLKRGSGRNFFKKVPPRKNSFYKIRLVIPGHHAEGDHFAAEVAVVVVELLDVFVDLLFGVAVLFFECG